MSDERFFTAYADFSECYKVGAKINGLPQGIIIHSTGAKNPHLKRYVKDVKRCGVNPYNNYMGSEVAAKAGNTTTPHAVAGLDINGEFAIAQILPYNMCCYGCAGTGNKTHIQIEICEDYENSKQYCYNILQMVAKWCAELCEQYKIDIDDIISHKEAHALGIASNHGDPEHWIAAHGYTMDDFRDWVREWARLPAITYSVQLGAFSVRENAEKFLKTVQIDFPDAFIKINTSK